MGKQMWSEKEKALLIELYPNHTDKELCEILGKTLPSLRGTKTRLGLRSKYKPKVNRIGEKYGQLTVTGEAEKHSGTNTRWICECKNCGATVTVCDYLLTHSDPNTHCKCTRKSRSGDNNPSYKHGGHGTKLYSIWAGMHNRCTNTNQWNYQYYGARGICICDEWKNFSEFHDWAINNGYHEGLSIDRIDPNKNYEPQNCRWIPLNEQQSNRRPFSPHKKVDV